MEYIEKHPDGYKHSHFGEFTYDPVSVGQQLNAPLLQAKRIFLQHGVIKDDISALIQKHIYYFSTVIASTKPEYDSLLDEKYGYDPETVQLLGLSRFDRRGLIDTERIILFSPTWRDSIIKPGPTGSFPYVEAFKQTEYFKWTSEILQNQRLDELMQKFGYTFVFKPHPGVLNQIPHYELNKNSSIRISLPDEKYSEMSSKSALLITDYSSVAFNFAYQKKPVIYYQCEPTHLKKSYFDYELDGFGEVVKTMDGLLDVLASYLRNNCKMKSEYEKRVLQTFPFIDRKNCEGTYQHLRRRYG
jgi:CDP-glycerol glycerophosphotransferase (TagB/SpsB family)